MENPNHSAYLALRPSKTVTVDFDSVEFEQVNPHLTLFFLPAFMRNVSLVTYFSLLDEMKDVVEKYIPLTAKPVDIHAFGSTQNTLVLEVEHIDLYKLRNELEWILNGRGINFSNDWPFVPHISIFENYGLYSIEMQEAHKDMFRKNPQRNITFDTMYLGMTVPFKQEVTIYS